MRYLGLDEAISLFEKAAAAKAMACGGDPLSYEEIDREFEEAKEGLKKVVYGLVGWSVVAAIRETEDLYRREA